MANVNALTSEAWSSEIDHIKLANASPYERKCYHNRYFLAWTKAVLPVLQDRGSGGAPPFRILDAACGAGDGTAYLAEQLTRYLRSHGAPCPCEVVGADRSEDALDTARNTYSSDEPWKRLQFVQRDICKAVVDARPDVLVSMETLEHLTEETTTLFLEAAAEYIQAGGAAVFSSPRLRPRESTVARPGHISEMYYQQFKYTISEYFPVVEFYSFDRYGNVVPDFADCNLQVAVARKWNSTKVF